MLWACNGKPCKTCTLQGCRSDTDACKTCKSEGDACGKHSECCGDVCDKGKGKCAKGYLEKPDVIPCDQAGKSTAAIRNLRIEMKTFWG